MAASRLDSTSGGKGLSAAAEVAKEVAPDGRDGSRPPDQRPVSRTGGTPSAFTILFHVAVVAILRHYSVMNRYEIVLKTSAIRDFDALRSYDAATIADGIED